MRTKRTCADTATADAASARTRSTVNAAVQPMTPDRSFAATRTCNQVAGRSFLLLTRLLPSQHRFADAACQLLRRNRSHRASHSDPRPYADFVPSLLWAGVHMHVSSQGSIKKIWGQYSNASSWIGPRNPKPRQITASGSGSDMFGKRSKSRGSMTCTKARRAT